MKNYVPGKHRGIDYNVVPDVAAQGDWQPGQAIPGINYWWPSDTEERWYKRQHTPQNNTLMGTNLDMGGRGLAWRNMWKDSAPDGSNPIIYNINSHAFRTQELDDVFDFTESIMCLGCSMTFGVGVHNETTWAYKLGQELNLPVINLGIPGGSLDAMYRVYSYWQPRIKSKYTVALMPPGRRMEIQRSRHKDAWHNGHWEKVGAHRMGDMMTINRPIGELFALQIFEDELYTVNTQKNINAIKHIAHETNSRFYLVDPEGVLTKDQIKARDGVHPGPVWHDEIKEMFINEISRDD